MSEQKSGLKGLVQEFRNRRVFRVAAVYLGTAFAILEAADIIVPMFGFPQISLVIILGLLMIGFPIATTLSWHLQFTEDGIRRSPKSGEKQTADHKPMTSNGLIVVLLIVIAGLLAYPRFQSDNSNSQASAVEELKGLDPKSVAVLPFINFSSSDEDAYFADGIHDDILTQLSKIRDLRVISRTTMMKYRESDKSILEIAKEIGSANVLEGSVRRAGDQVRIVAQLINARTDEHLWADTYDRDYADIFSIQTDVAKKIAGALQSALSPEEKANLAEIPTRNMQAYDFFLKGNYYWHTKTTKEGNLKAVAMYEEAIKLDPDFGLAYARQSIAHSVLFLSGEWDPSPERKALAKQTLDKAIFLIPDHPETHFAHGIYNIWCLKDREAAIEEFELAAAGQPKNGEIANHLGQLYAASGEWDKSGLFLKKAFELDPEILGHAVWVAGLYSFIRDFDMAEKYYRTAIQTFPENTMAYSFLSDMKKYAYGDLDGAGKILKDGMLNVDKPGLLVIHRFRLAMDLREFDDALKLMQEEYEGVSPSLYKGIALSYLGREEEMTVELERSLTNLNAKLITYPEVAYLYDKIGLAHAFLGHKAEAIVAGKKALEIEPVSKHALNGPDHLENLASIYAVLGEGDLALDIVDDLLSYPNNFTRWTLKLNPFFYNLRDLPRYQKLVGELS